MNCDDIPEKNFKVKGSDPHGFDGDNDGIGCESGKDPNPEPKPHKSDCDDSYPDDCQRISDELNMTGKLITITEINMRIENCLLCITNLDNDNLGFKESNFNHPFTLRAAFLITYMHRS